MFPEAQCVGIIILNKYNLFMKEPTLGQHFFKTKLQRVRYLVSGLYTVCLAGFIPERKRERTKMFSASLLISQFSSIKWNSMPKSCFY